jgi:hypothetical protein
MARPRFHPPFMGEDLLQSALLIVIVIAGSDAAMPAASASCPRFGKYFSVAYTSSPLMFRRQSPGRRFQTLLH